mmetsp:Transcript_32176/g.95826  ORF Transcript_32176/g.95826 Transcript_32176/m.95826 type:complete len:247 (-) Transcript_32176:95-835(-)
MRSFRQGPCPPSTVHCWRTARATTLGSTLRGRFRTSPRARMRRRSTCSTRRGCWARCAGRSRRAQDRSSGASARGPWQTLPGGAPGFSPRRTPGGRCPPWPARSRARRTTLRRSPPSWRPVRRCSASRRSSPRMRRSWGSPGRRSVSSAQGRRRSASGRRASWEPSLAPGRTARTSRRRRGHRGRARRCRLPSAGGARSGPQRTSLGPEGLRRRHGGDGQLNSHWHGCALHDGRRPPLSGGTPPPN